MRRYLTESQCAWKDGKRFIMALMTPRVMMRFAQDEKLVHLYGPRFISYIHDPYLKNSTEFLRTLGGIKTKLCSFSKASWHVDEKGMIIWDVIYIFSILLFLLSYKVLSSVLDVSGCALEMKHFSVTIPTLTLNEICQHNLSRWCMTRRTSRRKWGRATAAACVPNHCQHPNRLLERLFCSWWCINIQLEGVWAKGI